MRHYSLTSFGALALACTVALLPQTSVVGQSQWKAARTAWGDPDLTGIYSNSDESGIPFERPAQFEGRRLEDITA